MTFTRLQHIFGCLGCAGSDDNAFHDEKLALLSVDNSPRPAAEIADDVVNTILHTSLTGPALYMKLDSIVGTNGWKENVARWVLEKLTRALQDANDKLGPTVRDAYHKAWEVAKSIEGFVIEHPVMCTIIALGVLAILAPWALEALGFAELGPVEGMDTVATLRPRS